ncbi:MAG TPA: hypothetical protein DD708_05010 [Deltaproteobacteria bacterium]|nr:hypothetical protein [Deltaproteobacteria bacterium]
MNKKALKIFGIILFFTPFYVYAELNHIISVQPNPGSFSFLENNIDEFKKITIERPVSPSASMRELLCYQVYLHPLTHRPWYVWAASNHTFKGNLSLNTVPPVYGWGDLTSQAYLYELNENNKTSKALISFIKNKKGMEVSVFSSGHDLDMALSFSTEVSLERIQEKVFQEFFSKIFESKTIKVIDLFSPKVWGNVSRALVSEVPYGDSTKAFFGFPLSISGYEFEINPDVYPRILRIVSPKKKIELKSVLSGVQDMASLSKILETEKKEENKQELVKLNPQKMKFLKEDVVLMLLTQDPKAADRVVDEIMDVLDQNLAWDYMPFNLNSKDKIKNKLLTLAQGASLFHLEPTEIVRLVDQVLDFSSGFENVKAPRTIRIQRKKGLLSITDHLHVGYAIYRGQIDGKPKMWIEVKEAL